MEDNPETKKINFFERLKTAIFKLEDYGLFLEEKPSNAFKYFLLLIVLYIVIISFASTYSFNNVYQKIYDYINNEIPDFNIEDGILNAETYVEGYDEEYNFRLIFDTSNIDNEKIEEYRNKIEKSGVGLLLLKDKAIFYTGNNSSIENSYNDIIKEYKLNITNKDDLVKMFTGSQRISILVVFFLVNAIITFIIDFISMFADLCFVAIVGWFMARLCGIKLKMIGSMELSAYSLTLSIILSAIYTSACIFIPTFTMQYFNIFYLLVAYVYLIAALFIIKDDLIKQKQEIDKIKEVEEDVRRELIQEQGKEETEEKNIDKEPEEQKSKEDLEDDNSNNEEENNSEPDGSEI